MTAGTTVIAAVAVVVAPSRSVTEAVRVCAPTVRLAGTTVPPVPRLPSRLDDQRMAADRSPSSASPAVATRRSGLPVRNVPPAGGDRRVIVGATFGGRTVIVREAWPVTPAELVTAAVTVCVPTERWVAAKVGPMPISPSRSEVQRSDPERLPSAASVAAPVKVTLVPPKTVVALAGAEMVTVG